MNNFWKDNDLGWSQSDLDQKYSNNQLCSSQIDMEHVCLQFSQEKNTMIVGKQVKDCWGKNEGVGKMKKGETGFPHS